MQLAELKKSTATSLHGQIRSSHSAELLREFEQTGRPEPFQEIMRRHGGMVYATCLKVTRDAHDAEDATQATFLTLAAKGRVSGEIREPEAWLRKVAHRLALDLIRSRKRRGRREQLRSEMNDETTHLSSSDDAALSEQKKILNEEIAGLPASYRLPLILHYFGGLDREEMARQLNIKPATLGVRLHRAREQLRVRLRHRGVALPAAALSLLLHDSVRGSVCSAMLPAQSMHASSLAAGYLAGSTGFVFPVLGILRDLAGLGAEMTLHTGTAGKLKLGAMLAVLAGSITMSTAAVRELMPEAIRQYIPSLGLPSLRWPTLNVPTIQLAPPTLIGSQTAGSPRSDSEQYPPAPPLVLSIPSLDSLLSPPAEPPVRVATAPRTIGSGTVPLVLPSAAPPPRDARPQPQETYRPPLAIASPEKIQAAQPRPLIVGVASAAPFARAAASAPVTRALPAPVVQPQPASGSVGRPFAAASPPPAWSAVIESSNAIAAGPALPDGGAPADIAPVLAVSGQTPPAAQPNTTRNKSTKPAGNTIANTVTVTATPTRAQTLSPLVVNGFVSGDRTNNLNVVYQLHSASTLGSSQLSSNGQLNATPITIAAGGAYLSSQATNPSISSANVWTDSNLKWDSPAFVVNRAITGTGNVIAAGSTASDAAKPALTPDRVIDFDASGTNIGGYPATAWRSNRVVDLSQTFRLGEGGGRFIFSALSTASDLVRPAPVSRPLLVSQPALDVAPNGANSARLRLVGLPATATASVSMATALDADMPALPTPHVFIGVWKLNTSADFTSADLLVRYDELRGARLGLSEGNYKLWISDGKDWQLLTGDPTFGKNIYDNLIWASPKKSFDYFAISSPEPASLLSVFAAGLTLLRRRRRGAVAG